MVVLDVLLGIEEFDVKPTDEIPVSDDADVVP